MVKCDTALDLVFKALADPTRRAILARLAEGEANAGELAEPFRMSLPAVSKHLMVLEAAGLMTRSRDGRIHRLALDPAPLADAARWIEITRRFWTGQFDALAEFIEKDMPHEPRKSRSKPRR